MVFRGWLPDILEGLERSMLQGIPQRMITDIDWQQIFKAYPHLSHDGAFRDARHINNGSTGAQTAACLRTQAEALPLKERIDFIADQLRPALLFGTLQWNSWGVSKHKMIVPRKLSTLQNTRTPFFLTSRQYHHG